MIFYQKQPFHLPWDKLVGEWHVLATDFPMWLSNKRTKPRFCYTKVEKDGKTVLLDEVKYLKRGRPKSIVGYDFPEDRSQTKFVWRGKGLLAWLKSPWSIALMGKDFEWAVIIFEGTWLTPKGIDLVFRQPTANQKQLHQLIALCQRKGLIENQHQVKIL